MELLPQTGAFGDAFEHWVILEFIKLASYKRLDWSFSYLKTKDDAEIDLIIERPGQSKILIEIKSKTKVSEADVKSLENLGPDIDPKAIKWLLSNDQLERDIKTSKAMHWQTALTQLWNS